MDNLTERAVIFGRENNLLGIVSEPISGLSSGISVVLLNAGIIHRIGPSRFIVELARELALHGFRTLRFDLSGIGDSTLPKRQASLDEIVRDDINDAIDLATNTMPEDGGVVLVGLCSGADNAFHVASSDLRIQGLVLIDPMIYETWEFRRRRLIGRIRSLRSWLNLLSGRSLTLRILKLVKKDEHVLPPDHYGLLTDSSEEMRRKARILEDRGARLLYVITGGIHSYCNHPGQVADSIGLARTSSALRVEWRPQASHILSDRGDRRWLYDTIKDWIERLAKQ